MKSGATRIFLSTIVSLYMYFICCMFHAIMLLTLPAENILILCVLLQKLGYTLDFQVYFLAVAKSNNVVDYQTTFQNFESLWAQLKNSI